MGLISILLVDFQRFGLYPKKGNYKQITNRMVNKNVYKKNCRSTLKSIFSATTRSKSKSKCVETTLLTIRFLLISFLVSLMMEHSIETLKIN